MQSPKSVVAWALLLAALLSAGASVRAQGQDEDVLRIKTELVQTDLMVFDKQGRFVEGLTPEQFELTLDGKPHAVSLFERVAAGSSAEAALATARAGGPAKTAAANTTPTPTATGAGRVFFFFLDDLHL